ncbi:D-arabinono-1,4-lactone oxidase [Nocardioides bruguierae]|uniref:D-arabinono-1,4-lactone oxidase n=1 Tax=Nocardioides bruguierae TaxID=2945102 RepID=UPI0020205406|nr:D-arabinono-1,4-lactone oxidase [Nocardioides bruguierae]MCL8025312.1 FAD-binding protein [Nocardioides bruguierae]
MIPGDPRTRTRERNWAGTHTYAYRRLVHPQSQKDVTTLVAGASSVRAVGSRHSFNDVCDSDEWLVDVSGLAREPVVDVPGRTVTVTAGTRFGAVVRAVAAHDLALPNLGSLPHISVVGAVSTGTHGSGSAQQVLAAGVSRVRYVAASGRVRETRRGDPDFAGCVVALGALGIVLEVDLDLVPSFMLRQTCRAVRWSDVAGRLPEVLDDGYSVSVFTRWQDDDPTEVLRKAVPSPGAPAGPASDPSLLLGDGPNLTERDRDLPWHRVLPHFRVDHRPSFGAEIQSEYLVPRERATEAAAAVTALAPLLDPVLVLGEVRSVAADDLWLSPAHGRDSLCLHFTWLPRADEVAEAQRHLGAALAPLGARPHWGKVFAPHLFDLAALYPRLDDARALLSRQDPDGVFRNDFVARVLAR